MNPHIAQKVIRLNLIQSIHLQPRVSISNSNKSISADRLLGLFVFFSKSRKFIRRLKPSESLNPAYNYYNQSISTIDIV